VNIQLLNESGPNPLGPLSFLSYPDAILAGIAIATSSAFIGRAEELGRLSELLQQAEQGRRAVALMAGDAGVGKTRLLRELTDRAEGQGIRVLTGGCMETGDLGLPYVPFVDAFRDLGARPEEAELARSLVGAVTNLSRLLPPLGEDNVAAPHPSDEFEQVELFGGVLTLLVRLSEFAPLLLVIEDLHWADRSTRDLLSFLVRTLRSGRVAVVASYRSDELHRRHPLRPLLAELVRVPDLERIELSPFTREELTAHLEALMGEKIDPDTVDRILTRSEGNAFFVEELVAAGAIRSDVRLPEALADVLRNRVEALSDPAREILKVASASGRRVSHALLVAAAERPEYELEAAIREAIAGQVLVADPVKETYRFRHALLQEAVYGDLLPGERNRLHSTYARLLTGPGSAAERAHHCLASHDLSGALAALVEAATDARSASAPAETLSHLTQAIEIWEQIPDAPEVAGIDRIDLLLRTATAAGNSGEFRHAVSVAREAVAEVDADEDPSRAAVVHERLGEYLLQAGLVNEESLAVFRRAVDLVPADPPTELRAHVVAGLARALGNARCYEEARRWCDEALEVSKQVGAAVVETHALITLAVIERGHNNPEVGRSTLREARERAATIRARGQELRALLILGGLELDVGDLTAARAVLDEAVQLAEQTGQALSMYGINAGALRLFACYALGEWDQAESLAASVDIRLPGAAGLSAASLFVEVGRGRAGAEERLSRLEPMWVEDDWVAYLSGGCGADLALWRGDLAIARLRARRTLSLLEDSDETWELSVIWPATLELTAEVETAELARISGDKAAEAEAQSAGKGLVHRCRSTLERARADGRQVGPEAIAWLARAEAEWTRLEGRSDPVAWAAAAEAFAYGYVYEEARCRWRLAEALLGAGRRDEAAEQARAAHSVASKLGAQPLQDGLEALARRGRIDLGSDVAPREGSAGLTARELEVLRLVAEGRSNQQIAETLFISRKTASVHVSHILAKMGVHTRVEAAAAAHRLGLDGDAFER
jgi:DNA-binding NarL/FixJ family response regulator